MFADLAQKYGRNVFIHGGTKPYITLAYDKQVNKLDQTLAFLQVL